MEQCNERPKVSVIIPVYNTCNYVQEALESICQQTLEELEIIVIDDGSTDCSRAIVEEIAIKDTRIQVYKQSNQGLSITRNQGLKFSTGEYIYFMDSDDFLEPMHLNYVIVNAQKKLLILFSSMLKRSQLNRTYPKAPSTTKEL
ncbi:glycosyltransferase [Bacteroides fragilis]|nr:glycosyltransferase [Bacteroides fragilis]